MTEERSTQTEVAHNHDTVRVPLLGEVTVTGGIYTVVFGVLAVLTLLEVSIAEVLRSNPDLDTIRIGANLFIAACKSALVVWFYMHLNKDNRLFLVVLLVPLFLVIISILFLTYMPMGAGLGYS